MTGKGLSFHGDATVGISTELQIRRVSADESATIMGYLAQWYSEEELSRVTENWIHENVENPVVPKGLSGSWVVETDTGTIVAHSGVILVPYSIDGREVLAGYGVDLHVHPDYRGRGLAKKLLSQTINDIDAYINISMAFSTRKLMEKMGAFPFVYANELILPLIALQELGRIGNRLYCGPQRLRRLTRLSRKLPVFSTLVLHVLNHRTERRRKRVLERNRIALEIIQREVNDLDFDWIWRNTDSKSGIRRSPEILRWMYTDQRKKKYFAFEIRSGTVCEGVCIYRISSIDEGNVCVLCETVVANASEVTKVYRCMVVAVIHGAQAVGSHFIYSVSASEELTEELHRAGSLNVNSHVGLLLSRTVQPPLTEHHSYLTASDHEFDRWPLSRFAI